MLLLLLLMLMLLLLKAIANRNTALQGIHPNLRATCDV